MYFSNLQILKLYLPPKEKKKYWLIFKLQRQVEIVDKSKCSLHSALMSAIFEQNTLGLMRDVERSWPKKT